ncbi:MAG TPA: ABC transporter ATP-binding protein [Burkholderiales bacterium]|nr:ABC transporter ATP-binding protein [Burkholderiales bacterium]
MALEVRSLSTGYDGRAVVHAIDLAVNPGEIVALVGANGAGKSTLAKAISGLLRVQAGSILLDGRPIDDRPPAERVRLGVAHVPEGRQVFAGLTIAENLRLGAHVHRAQLGDAGMRRRIAEACESFPVLLERIHQPAGTLSGGQQQMLAIARGLMAQPRYLVLDEPSLGLSPILVVEIFRMIEKLRARGLAILLSEQNARMSLAIADRAYVIETGRVVIEGGGRELLARPEVAERYLGVGRGVGTLGDERRLRLTAGLRKIF